MGTSIMFNNLITEKVNQKQRFQHWWLQTTLSFLKWCLQTSSIQDLVNFGIFFFLSFLFLFSFPLLTSLFIVLFWFSEHELIGVNTHTFEQVFSFLFNFELEGEEGTKWQIMHFIIWLTLNIKIMCIWESVPIICTLFPEEANKIKKKMVNCYYYLIMRSGINTHNRSSPFICFLTCFITIGSWYWTYFIS